MITTYSPQKLALATPAGYEGVVIQLDDFFDPDKLSDAQINQVLAASRDAGARIISIECMWGLNHIDPSTAERTRVHARFIRCLEFAHRLGCKFVGTFSGGIPRAPAGKQGKELAPVLKAKYIPVWEKLHFMNGWGNYSITGNVATTA